MLVLEFKTGRSNSAPSIFRVLNLLLLFVFTVFKVYNDGIDFRRVSNCRQVAKIGVYYRNRCFYLPNANILFVFFFFYLIIEFRQLRFVETQQFICVMEDVFENSINRIPKASFFRTTVHNPRITRSTRIMFFKNTQYFRINLFIKSGKNLIISCKKDKFLQLYNVNKNLGGRMSMFNIAATARGIFNSAK